MKKKTIIIISVSLVIVSLIVSALLISYNKFGTINLFSAVNGYFRVVNTNAQAVTIQKDKKSQALSQSRLAYTWL